MLLSLQPNWWDDWLLYHKVIFDGENRRIYIADDVSTLSVKIDLYSSWKEWLQLRDHAKFVPAFRTIGGDSLGGGLYAGDIYFLINGWQIVVDQNIKVAGILYHDDPLDPFIIMPGGGLTATVSSLAYAYSTGTNDPWATDVSEYGANTAGKLLVDTKAAIPSSIDTANAVWNKPVTESTTTGTFGKLMQQLLTVAKFLGLK